MLRSLVAKEVMGQAKACCEEKVLKSRAEAHLQIEYGKFLELRKYCKKMELSLKLPSNVSSRP